MVHYLKKGLETAVNLPGKIGIYRFHKRSSSNRVLIVQYRGESSDTRITISIYNELEEPVPKELNHPLVKEEFESCIRTMLHMEKEGLYSNAELLKRQYYFCGGNKQPIFHCAAASERTAASQEGVFSASFRV